MNLATVITSENIKLTYFHEIHNKLYKLMIHYYNAINTRYVINVISFILYYFPTYIIISTIILFRSWFNKIRFEKINIFTIIIIQL